MKDLKLIDWMILIALVGMFFSPYVGTMLSAAVVAVLISAKLVMMIVKYFRFPTKAHG
ncbi:MAG: hypothetical protein FWC51_00640 [Proteobacteria bacterium]|nr:hypothetical protein [Pseudomonadota bacterium]